MLYPALDVRGADPELAVAAADDFSPSAVEELPDGVSIFFRSRGDRDQAHHALARTFPGASVAAREVDDEDWARRSQQNLTPVTVGRVTVLPPWALEDALERGDAPDCSPADRDRGVSIVIAPSMGFGTGHHATTRLCLAALQALPLQGRRVLDVGTGSGVLAIAARLLGAAAALGIDVDGDAIESAQENLTRNPGVDTVSFVVADLQSEGLPQCDVVLANLTGTTLAQHAEPLMRCTNPGGALIVSGLLEHERDAVLRAFARCSLVWSQGESGWVGLTLSTG